MIQIRKIKPDELPKLKDMLGNYLDCLDGAFIKNKTIAVCIINYRIVGCGFSQVIDNQCFISGIYVQAEHRRDQIGTAIVRYLLNLEEQQGIMDAYLLTPYPSFAEKLGFSKDTDKLNVLSKYHQTEELPQGDNYYYVSLINYFKSCPSEALK